jgi:hypothetical protein
VRSILAQRLTYAAYLLIACASLLLTLPLVKAERYAVPGSVIETTRVLAVVLMVAIAVTLLLVTLYHARLAPKSIEESSRRAVAITCAAILLTAAAPFGLRYYWEVNSYVVFYRPPTVTSIDTLAAYHDAKILGREDRLTDWVTSSAQHSVQFTTSDEPDKVIAHYKRLLHNDEWEVVSNSDRQGLTFTRQATSPGVYAKYWVAIQLAGSDAEATRVQINWTTYY